MFRRNKNNNIDNINILDQNVTDTVDYENSEDDIENIKNDNSELFDILIKERIKDIHDSISKRRYEIRFIKTSNTDSYLNNWHEIALIARRYYESLNSDYQHEYLEVVEKTETAVAEMHYIIEIRKVFNDDFNLIKEEDEIYTTID